EPGPPSEVEEEQHVARRERGDERLFGIDSRRVRPWRGNDVRAGARRNHRAAVERPFVRSAVLALGEALAALLAMPADRGGVGAHGVLQNGRPRMTKAPSHMAP